MGFNPLHCGAVVASQGDRGDQGRRCPVSIPFIAGQWSLRPLAERRGARRKKFQSPSLRGSGRFSLDAARSTMWLSSFNPLHCGAVVASIEAFLSMADAVPCFNPLHCGAVVASWRYRPPIFADTVSIPFIAGQWSLHVAGSPARLGGSPVSIPFIAGQWSLPLRAAPHLALGGAFQSPSLRGSGRFPRSPYGGRGRRKVSIPFIAGQWSLRDLPVEEFFARVEFQSPSLRGSGRFPVPTSPSHAHPPCFNPLHCGAVVAS